MKKGIQLQGSSKNVNLKIWETPELKKYARTQDIVHTGPFKRPFGEGTSYKS